ncbi:MAG: hypothetical protein ACRDVD_00685 [Acidimicrobiia bacterium]
MARHTEKDSDGEISVRRRLLFAGVSVAACAVVAVAGVAWWPGDGKGVARIGQLAPADAVLTLGTASYNWEVSPAALSWATEQVTADGIMYVLSTGPGVQREQVPNGNLPGAAIYSSTDGVAWAVRRVVGDWIDSITASAGMLHAIGTVPGTEDGSLVLQVGTSVDEGATFATTLLPFRRVDSGIVDARVLANGASVLALVTLTETIEIMSLLPPEVQETGGYPLLMSDRIGIFSGESIASADLACFSGDSSAWGHQPECEAYFESDAIFVATWEELGLEGLAPIPGDPGGMHLGEKATRGAYFSADGEAFEEVEFPFLPAWIDRVFDVGDTTVVSVSGMGGGASLMASDDLRTWQPIAEDVGAAWFMDIGMVSDEYVLVGGALVGSKPVVYRTEDLFGQWVAVEVGDLLPSFDDPEKPMWVNSAAIGAGGVAINIGAGVDGSEGNPIADLIGRVLPGRALAEGESSEVSLLLVSHDLATWNLAWSDEIGGIVEQVFFSPQGELITTVRDPQGHRLDVVAGAG